jgi:lysozyme
MTQTTTHALDATVSATASKATYGGAGMTIGGWFLSSEFAVLVGMLAGVCGLLVNWYYKAKEDRRLQAEHDRRMSMTDTDFDELATEVQTRLSAGTAKRRRRQSGKIGRMPLVALTLSAAALVGIAVNEGYRGEAYHATPHEKAAGISTIGFGTTEGVRPGDKITPERALGRKLADVQKFEGALKTCVRVPLHQYEYDAYISLSYNIGSGAFCRSTLVRLLNAGDYARACAQILRWNRQNGQVLRGLTTRRQQEYLRCTGMAK